MIIKITPDKERVKSILKLIKRREEFLSSADSNFPTIIAENYYEILKELATAILNLKGKKAVGKNAHKETIDNLSKYKKISEYDISIMQDLRIKRNKSQYEGERINSSYMENKKRELKKIGKKLKDIIKGEI
jgi:hypothetical protein